MPRWGTPMNTFAEKNHPSKTNADLQLNYPPALYHKLLDYRVTEILLGTLAVGALLFLRLHR